MKYLSDEYVKVYTYKGYDICILKVASPEKGDKLGYCIDDEKFDGYEYSDLGQAVQDIDDMLKSKMTNPKDNYDRGFEASDDIFNSLLPFRVYKDYDVGRFGKNLSPVYELKCAFATKELADGFIKAQQTVEPRTKYFVEELPNINKFRKELKQNGYIDTKDICENYKKLVHEAGHNITLNELADAFNSSGEHSVYLNNIGEELKAQEFMKETSVEIE